MKTSCSKLQHELLEIIFVQGEIIAWTTICHRVLPAVWNCLLDMYAQGKY